MSTIAVAGELTKLQEVPFTQVQIEDKFWAPRRKINREIALDHALAMIEKYGNMPNFDLAATGKHEGYQNYVFADSDPYKVLESISYSLATDPDAELDKKLDKVIARMAAAQQPDGYLNTYYEVKEPGKRLTNLRDNHELYCAGHLIEAAVAHAKATKKKNLLTVAVRYADFLCETFGEGKRAGYCGHPEIELALMKLYRLTGSKRYADLATFFVNHRGEHFFAKEHNTPDAQYDGTYWQDDVPIRDHERIKGHAVRAGYLMSGVTDVARENGDESLLTMVNRVWKNAVNKNLYVTGGMGSSGSNEGFTTDYDLPNLSAYQETCATVAMLQWSHRLNLLYGDSKFADIMETGLYNGMLSGVSLDGLRYFYVNPLESSGGHHRSEWFGCACCPPNVTRTLAALGDYVFATKGDALWVNLYIAGRAKPTVGQSELEIKTETNYPWEGAVKFTLNPQSSRKMALHLRIPSWCSSFSVSINGKRVAKPEVEKGYVILDQEWQKGSTIALNLDMPIRRVEANPNVMANVGRLALARGPLVYCLEGCDNTVPLNQIAIPSNSKMKTVGATGKLKGMVAIQGEAWTAPTDWQRGLYRTAAAPGSTTFTAIPYFAWDNREPGRMLVWAPVQPPAPPGGGLERVATIQLSFTSDWAKPYGINDGIEPRSSKEHPGDMCHFWPHKGGDEWIEYHWKAPIKTASCEVYWFDDTGTGECRPPASWEVQARIDGKWVTVNLKGGGYQTVLDRWCKIEFDPVKTDALRLNIKMQDKWAVGIHEWRVIPVDEES